VTNILLVGDHPDGFTGNGHMLKALLNRIDYTKFNISVFASTSSGIQTDVFDKQPYHLIEGGKASEDPRGCNQLLNTIYQSKPDVVMFVGLDIWLYSIIHKELMNIKKEKPFVWISLFPYDFTFYRNEWEEWLKPVDLPLVYSQYGLNELTKHDSRIRYFRPPLYDSDKFTPYSREKRLEVRKKIFHTLNDDTFLFGFFGANQIRKDPLRVIKAFFDLKETHPDTSLYLHTEVQSGVFNIKDYLTQFDNKIGDVYHKTRMTMASTTALVELYNCCDCLINVSLQEGLSWTLLEAMLCGTPVLAANNTSQIELIKEGAGVPLKCSDIAYIPISLPDEVIQLEAQAVNYTNLCSAMDHIATDKELQNSLKEKGLVRAKEWLEGVSDINLLLEEASAKPKANVFAFKQKAKKVLFIQHSSAGDVLMSTQCFKGLKEKHKWPLVYMTQPQYQDIVKNNPYIDEIINYDLEEAKKYAIVYNPHGEKILPGGWNNLDVTLHSMYPYFCKVEADDIFIDLQEPDIELPEKYIVVHTTGGSIEYRTYAHMDMVAEKLSLPIIQIGGRSDRKVKKAIDLREKLSFRETAYIMKHAEAAVVIDSFPAHLAGALGTPVVVLFGPAPARVTHPKGDRSKMVFLEPNMLDVCNILSHCWSASLEGKTKCKAPCINTISPQLILQGLSSLGIKEIEK
jgi:ADP-heptose:LPS heptosyltransferase/glycosyltransferase involved in cell wall biosynthesis